MILFVIGRSRPSEFSIALLKPNHNGKKATLGWPKDRLFGGLDGVEMGCLTVYF
jgi:hypothetical protein